MSFLLNPFVFAAAGDFESIATVTVGSGGAASIQFSNIPQTYTHLQIRTAARSTKSNVNFGYRWGFNGNTASDKKGHYLYGDGGSAVSGAQVTTSVVFAGVGSAATSLANNYGAGIFDFLDYADSSKNTVMRCISGYDNNGSGFISVDSGAWFNTAAVTSISVVCDTGNWAQYTTAALYGIKA